jgi:hypothetical protein
MPSLRESMAKFAALDNEQQRVFVVAVVWLPLFGIGLRAIGIARSLRWLQARSRPPGDAPHGTLLELDGARRIGDAVNAAARHGLVTTTCLPRSFLLAWLLQRRGIDCTLKIGVKVTTGLLAAHAWVEYRDVPVNDRVDIGLEFASFDHLVPLAAFLP